MADKQILYTIGHSVHSIETFLDLLKLHGITAVCDVRSRPFSRVNPQFNQDSLQQALNAHGIWYGFLGRQLGARPADSTCYISGKASYSLIASSDAFHDGLRRLRKGMQRHRVALMCAEKDPITCHRAILVCRHMRQPDIKIMHILESGMIEMHQDAELRLLNVLSLPRSDLFENTDSIIERAYDLQGEKIAYQLPEITRETQRL